MTTAREKAEAFAQLLTHDRLSEMEPTPLGVFLLELVDQRFAELREKERESCLGPKHSLTSESPSASLPSSFDSCCSSKHNFDAPATSPATAEAWEPTDEQIAAVVRAAMRDNEQQIEVLKNQWRNNWKSATFGLIAGYRIAKETPCNQ